MKGSVKKEMDQFFLLFLEENSQKVITLRMIYVEVLLL